MLSLPDLIRVSQLDDDLTQVPALLFQLTDWIYAFVSRVQITEGDTLPKPLRDTYHACLSWYSSTLAREGGKQGPKPFVQYVTSSAPVLVFGFWSALFANDPSLYYHFCLLTLFRPFCHVNSVDVVPVEICLESADSVLTLTKACRQLEGFQLMCFVPLFVHAAAQLGKDIVVGREVVADGPVSSLIAQSARARNGSTSSDASGGSLLSELSADKKTASRSLTDRALEQLLQLSELYPSARKAASELQRVSSRRVSDLGG